MKSAPRAPRAKSGLPQSTTPSCRRFSGRRAKPLPVEERAQGSNSELRPTAPGSDGGAGWAAWCSSEQRRDIPVNDVPAKKTDHDTEDEDHKRSNTLA
jgi:hypothetical protein